MIPALLVTALLIQAPTSTVERQIFEAGREVVSILNCADFDVAVLDVDAITQRHHDIKSQAQQQGLDTTRIEGLVEQGMQSRIDDLLKQHPDIDSPDAIAAFKQTCRDYIARHPADLIRILPEDSAD